MSEFRFEHRIGEGYDNVVTVDVRVLRIPSQEDYKELIDAVSVIDKFAKKYVSFKEPIIVKEGKK